MKKRFIVKLISPFLLGLVFISACQNRTVINTPTLEESSSPAMVESTETTIPSTPSPTEIPKTVYFVNNSPEDAAEIETISAYLTEYSATNGFVFQKNNSLSDINPNQNDVVVMVENETNKFEEASVKADVGYVVFTLDNQPLSGGVYQIKQNSAEQVFLAGYVSQLIADDWRVGGILPDQSISGTRYEQIFKNGGHYLCGRCAPVYAPVVFFPVTAAVDSPGAVFDAYSQLESDRVFVVYLPEKFLTSELYTTLRENKRIIISDTPPSSETEPFADLYIYQDFISPLNEALLNINNPEKSLRTTKLMIRDSSNKLSQGKLNFIQQVITNLESGLLSPYTVIEN